MLAHMKSLLFIAAATGAGLVSVNAFSLSTSCQTALRGLLTSEDSACLNPTALLSIAFQDGGSSSVPAGIDSWLNGMCSQGSCSDESIANIITGIASGCSDDLASLGISASDISTDVVNVAQQVYPAVRQAMCLKDDNSNQMCVTEMLTNLESIIGGLSVDDLSFLNIVADVQQLLASGVQNLACTNCVKAAFSIAQESFPSIVSQAQPEAEALCGANFVDGSSVAGISETANPEVFVAQPPAENNGFALSHGTSYVKTGMVLGATFATFAFLL